MSKSLKNARKRLPVQCDAAADDVENGGGSSNTDSLVDKKNNSVDIWRMLHITLTLLGVVAIMGFVYEFSLNRVLLEKVVLYEELIQSYDARVLQNMHILSSAPDNGNSGPVTVVAPVVPVVPAAPTPCPVCDYSKCMTSCPTCPTCPHCPAVSESSAETALSEKLAKQTKKADLLLARNTPLTVALQESSKAELLARYGPGPYVVDISFSFPDSPDRVDNIAVEMAPSHLMPYTVAYFLRQVEAGVWRGCSFMRNAGHVIQAGTVPSGPMKDNCKNKKFKELGLPGVRNDGVLFQEYSSDYPHKKYTVGLAGRPGGPDFYISILDNTANHGPGGQGQYGLAAEADACFGRVLDDGVSIANIKRMHKFPLRTPGKGYEYFKDAVGIVDMELRRPKV